MKPGARFYSQGPSGVSYYRCELPARATSSGYEVRDGLGRLLESLGPPRWTEVSVVSQPFTQYRYDVVKRALKAGSRVIVDVDDWIPALPFERKMVERWRRGLELADAITCSTQAIKDRLEHCGKPIYVCPNGIDLEPWNRVLSVHNNTGRIVEDDQVVIGFAGSSNHRDAFMGIAPQLWEVMNELPNTVLLTVGMQLNPQEDIPVSLQGRYMGAPWSDLAAYRHAVCQFDVSIGPAGRDEFYACKSDIRMLEAWASGAQFLGDSFVYPEGYGLRYAAIHAFGPQLEKMIWAHPDNAFVGGPAPGRTMDQASENWRKAIEGVASLQLPRRIRAS